LDNDVLLQAAPEASVRDAAIGMASHHCGAVLVCRDDTLIGIVTERDLIAGVVALGRDLDTPLIEVMSANPDTIEATAPIGDAVRRMKASGHRHLPVIENDRVLGLLSLGDLPLAEFAAAAPAPEMAEVLVERAG
jgi:CBS domain-containing protein